MNRFEWPSGVGGPGISRRELLCRLGGGIAGALLATAGLIGDPAEVRAARVVSLRTALQQISGGCDPSHGIRLMLPVEGPVISLLDVIHRYYHP